MNIALILAAVALVPQPAKLVETGGVTKNAEIRYVTDSAVPAEGYRLKVAADGITVTSSDAAGRFYAGMTLAQLKDGNAWPCVEIEDAPAYRWRGAHLDECRHFFGKETVKQMLDLMAQHKLNRFHWHLTEDQGWRLDIPGYPELIKYGAARSASVRHGQRATKGSKEDADKLNGVKYGPYYYTEADVREIIAYAAERHITIVPEIELPGHVFAALAAYPEFACVPANLAAREPRLVWGIEKDVLCLGNDKAIKFMEDVAGALEGLPQVPGAHQGGGTEGRARPAAVDHAPLREVPRGARQARARLGRVSAGRRAEKRDWHELAHKAQKRRRPCARLRRAGRGTRTRRGDDAEQVLLP